jgi:hypothetical protein
MEVMMRIRMTIACDYDSNMMMTIEMIEMMMMMMMMMMKVVIFVIIWMIL